MIHHAALEDDGRVGGDAPEALFDVEVLEHRTAVLRAVRALGAADALVEVGHSATVLLLLLLLWRRRRRVGSARREILGEFLGLRKERAARAMRAAGSI